MKRAAGFALLLSAVCCAAAQGQSSDSLRTSLGVLPDFKLTDQAGASVGRERLFGRVCVVSVFFACCIDSCTITQKQMANLQDKFAAYPDVLLVSINVYPGHDTPEIIAQYATEHHADPARWVFLHGDKDEIYNLVQKGLFQGLAENPSSVPGREVAHTPNFLVVDHRGVIRGYVDGTKPDEVDRLEQYVKKLVQAAYLPTVNATLNGSCAVLLVVGFVFIRRRWIALHKAVMLSALATSAAFLGCYLYYHFAILEGKSTPFDGVGPIRLVYYGILLSHILLAVPVLFMALRLTYLGLRNRLSSHVRLARWTLPMWLYVSVTGVVVYLMLYHLYPPV